MLRAVICDDEKAALTIIRFLIEKEKLPIEIVGTAENGRDALRLIQEEKPDLVFMDINMPYMSGLEIVQNLKGIKVIIITAYDSFEHAQRALRLGVCDILAKPIDMEQLRSAIERAVGWNFTPSETVNKALGYLYGHYPEKLELSALAAQTYCSEGHLAREFKKYTGMSVLTYLHKVRIENSIRLLEGGMAIKEAAEAVGYQNLNHFYKYFRQYTEKTPAEYMRTQNLLQE